MTKPLRLLVFDDSSGIAIDTLTVGTSLIIGRGGGADLILDDPQISDLQCRFEREGEHLFVTGIDGGTRVNGRSLEPSGRFRLENGDAVQFGRFAIRVDAGADNADAAPPAPESGGWDAPARPRARRGDTRPPANWGSRDQPASAPPGGAAAIDPDDLTDALLTGLVAALAVRARERAEAGISSASSFDRGNPLAGAGSADDAMQRLSTLAGVAELPARAIAEAYAAIARHNEAKLPALQDAFAAAMARFAPAEIRERAPAGLLAGVSPLHRDAALWRRYEAEFMDPGGFLDRLAIAFAEGLAQSDRR